MNATRIHNLALNLRKPRESVLESVSDADLLSRFLDYRDEAAFEELVGRHLPAVRAICRSLLRDTNDVDDAVQATFLVLVRRAQFVRNGLAVGSWLYRVAWRTASRLRESNVRRGKKLIPDLDPDTTPDHPASAGSNDLVSAVKDEIRLLPERYRIAVLTCYCAGLPTAEAARRLGWPKGTLLTRLAWARKRLRQRLLKRGIAPVGCFTTMLADRSTTAARAVLVCRYTAAGMAMATGNTAAMSLVSERVSTLTEGMVRNMIATKMKLVLGIGILIAALVGLGLGRMTFGVADAAAGDKKTATTLIAPGADTGSPQAKNALPQNEGEPVIPAVASDLVVRRPLGNYTREVPAYGKATLTFTENRIHLQSTIRIEKATFTLTGEADYTLNRESMVYGIITGVDLGGGGLDEEEAAFIATYLNAVNDTPFSFRIRVEDDALMIKDIKWGGLGATVFSQLLGEGNSKETLNMATVVTSIACGKYKSDPNPERIQPPAPVVKPKRK